jgi:uncharacterized protein YndB with AHSA1/START domain
MSVKKEASGRRSVQVEVELPGTPEQIWRAIATGPGISAWFCPTDLEERNGGKMVMHMAPGMDSEATITVWEPPKRLAADAPGWMPDMPPVATEWTIEARPGGTCLVRVVHSLFASTDDWDNQLEGTESGWPGFFRILRLYLLHYPGQPCSSIQAMAMGSGDAMDAWKKLAGALGLEKATVGQKVGGAGGAPVFAGTVEMEENAKDHHGLLVRLEQPAPGLASLGAVNCSGMVMAMITFYLYGDRAHAAAQRDTQPWQEWLAKLFPQAEAAGTGA